MTLPSQVSIIIAASLPQIGMIYNNGTPITQDITNNPRAVRNIAYAIYLRGALAVPACFACQDPNHKYYFRECVVMAGYMQAKYTNCHWRNDGYA
jgi:hypothetical protein